MSRKNVSLVDEVERRANEIINARGLDGLSDLIKVLVREEFDRRGLVLEDKPMSDEAAANSAKAGTVGAAIASVLGAQALKGGAANQPVKYPPARRSKKKSTA